MGFEFETAAPRIRLLIDLVRKIQSIPRHLGQHSGGMVVASQPLDEIVPLEPAATLREHTKAGLETARRDGDNRQI